MPTYDYICSSCHNAWELEQRIVEDPIRKCPKCGKNTAKRQISSGAGFILKGGGWYADGYGSKKASSSDSKSDDKSSSGESKTDKTKTEPSSPSGDAKKSESKPASGGESSSGEGKGPAKKAATKAGPT